ncbi:MAG: hypothetical protein JO146_03310 [Candidatus Eremiobacteraeota bacterium]|nr:hypothetical protein [Candidatus Eremiobacteraeota bacterium]
MVVAACCAFIPATARAIGTLNIHQGTGKLNTYKDVEIKVFSGSLFLTSDDGNGTIVITRAACSFQGEILVCFPTAAALVQDGESSALNLKSGTLYFNSTNAAQPLSRSSAKLPPNSVMATLALNDGTSINVTGRIDEVIGQ